MVEVPAVIKPLRASSKADWRPQVDSVHIQSKNGSKLIAKIGNFET
jgi:hypothetical protein